MAIYKRDIASINLETGTIHRTFLNHSIGYKDQKADHFGIRVFRDGEPVDLTGVSVQGIFMPPQGDPIAITSGNIVDGNVAEVVLPQACYNYDGQFCLSIKLVDSNNSVTGTMRIVDGMVDNTHASGTVAPTSAVPTYQEILSAYDAMVAATAAANGAIAATYSSSSTYKVGDYCIHDGGLYRCTTAITTAEAWTSGHWTAAKLGPDLSDVKSALDGIGETYPTLTHSFASGGITTTGVTNTNNKRIRSASSSSTAVPIIAGDFFYVDPAYIGVLHIYDSTVFNSTHHVAKLSSGSGVLAIPDTYVGDYAAISLSKVGYEDSDISGDLATIATKVLYCRSALGNRRTDKTLALEDYPADAKTTGDKMAEEDDYIKRNIQLSSNWNILEYSSGNINDGGGISSDNLTRIRTASSNRYTPKVEIGDFVWIDPAYEAKVALYTSRVYNTTNFSSFVSSSFQSGFIKIPDSKEGKYVGIVIRKIGYEDSDISADIPLMQTKVRYIRPTKNLGSSDGERPIYVAFGASTTEGAVHDDGNITKTANNFPAYLSSVLGLETYNLATGSTGFLARGDRSSSHYGDTDYYMNFCDTILANDGLLSKAKLITIMFGYGNDHYIGPTGSGRRFFIGEYTDYYPYDVAAQTITDFDKAAGLSAMIDGGATLMGCLNWCIKYISEHYPLAQLVIIFGSPSANDCRAISIAENSQTPAQGVAPYKITFTEDPYKDAEDHTSAEYGIYQINEELKKLKTAMDIPIVNLFYEGNAFNWYSTYAKNPDDASKYALFSTTADATSDTSAHEHWNAHPNEAGYLYYARYVAGKVISLFKH